MMPGVRAGLVWWMVDWSASSIVAGPWSRHQLCLATCVPPVCHYTIHFPPAQGSIHCQDAAVILIQDTLLLVQGFSKCDINLFITWRRHLQVSPPERSSSTIKFKNLCQPNPNFWGETVLKCTFLLVARCLVNS